MTNKIYNKIKHYRVYIGRYGTTMLIKHCNFPNKKKSMDKRPIFKEHSYTKSNNTFLL